MPFVRWFLLTLPLLVFAQYVHALPASARLFQKQYGYKVSCLLCHADGGGSANNGYGKAFLRAGANLAAFKKIEDQDSDGDSLKNLAEILAKANPGDKRSTPSNVGDWLANVGSTPIPQKELEKLFPGYKKFSALEGSLKPEQVESLKSRLGREPTDDDKVPTFYFAERDGKREAVGQLVSEQAGDKKSLAIGVAVASSGKVLSVLPLGGSVSKDLSEDGALFKTYSEKTATTLPPKPQDEVPAMVYSGVQRSLMLMQVVFGGGGAKK